MVLLSASLAWQAYANIFIHYWIIRRFFIIRSHHFYTIYYAVTNYSRQQIRHVISIWLSFRWVPFRNTCDEVNSLFIFRMIYNKIYNRIAAKLQCHSCECRNLIKQIRVNKLLLWDSGTALNLRTEWQKSLYVTPVCRRQYRGPPGMSYDPGDSGTHCVRPEWQ